VAGSSNRESWPQVTRVACVGGEPVIVRLQGGASLSGRLVDSQGRPRGLEVLLLAGTRRGVISLADGAFRISGLTLGSYDLQLLLPSGRVEHSFPVRVSNRDERVVLVIPD